VQVSYFETARYLAPQPPPSEWPVPPGAYDPEAGARAYRGMVERLEYVEKLGFDWISVSEHHYSPRILTPNPNVSAAFLAARSANIKIAALGPIVSQSNPVQVAEEFAMLDNLAQGRLVVGLLRRTTNEYLTFGLNPAEARERTTEGMELILKAWTEPQPFGWQGRHFQYRTVSVWPRPLQQPHPPTAPAPNPATSPRVTISASVSPSHRSKLCPSRLAITASSASAMAGSRARNRSCIGQT
jgi:alkanesulfonate monooxygenase SsuD/methylene tetrahydromethanopterin reductase-like flavin-dependent oxidoreductase (luciferase family)